MTSMMPAPKPHDPRTPTISVDDIREHYEQALLADTDAMGQDDPEAELTRFEAAYGVLAAALQDGK